MNLCRNFLVDDGTQFVVPAISNQGFVSGHRFSDAVSSLKKTPLLGADSRTAMELSSSSGCPMIQDTRVPVPVKKRGNANGILHGRRWSVFDRSKNECNSPVW